MVWSLQAASSYLGRSWRALQGERRCDHCQGGMCLLRAIMNEVDGLTTPQWIPNNTSQLV